MASEYAIDAIPTLPNQVISPIDELLAVKDISYSNMFYVEFLFDKTSTKEVDSTATTDGGEEVTDLDPETGEVVKKTVPDYRTLDNRLTLGYRDLFTDSSDFKYKSSNFDVHNRQHVFTRIEDFSLPAQVSDTHSMSYFDREFQRVSTTYKQSKVLSITFTLDDYFALLFKLSQIGDFNLSDINKSFGKSALNRNDVCIDIKLFTGFLNENETDSGVYYTFKNAKMLGFDNSLKFTRDSVQKMQITVSFRYQDMVKVNNPQ